MLVVIVVVNALIVEAMTEVIEAMIYAGSAATDAAGEDPLAAFI